MQHVLFGREALEEIEVCFRPVLVDGITAFWEDVFASSGAILEEAKATISRCSSGQLPQALPGDAFNKISSQCPVLDPRGPNCHVAGSPGDVWQAPPANIASAQVLEVGMHPLVAFVLAPPSPVTATTPKQFRPNLANCFSMILLTSTPFFPGQCMMSARQVLLSRGGSSQEFHSDRSL